MSPHSKTDMIDWRMNKQIQFDAGLDVLKILMLISYPPPQTLVQLTLPVEGTTTANIAHTT